MLAVVSELLWSLRREGFTIATPQALAAARVVELLGWEDPEALEHALSCVIVTRRADLAPFARNFRDFFSTHRGHPGDLYQRLRGRGVSDGEVDAIRQLLEGAAQRSGQVGGEGTLPRALTGTSYELDWLLRAARLRRVTAGLGSARTLGFFTERAAKELGLGRAASALTRVAAVLAESFGAERGAAIAALLREELDAVKRRIRAELGRSVEQRNALAKDVTPSGLDVSFGALDEAEALDVRRAIKRLAEQLGGAARVRQRRARRGSIDVRRTLRASARTLGVPMVRLRKRPRRDRPKLVVLCDVSDSVRSASRFLLELVSAVSTLFRSVRSFVFVGEPVETTALFERSRASGALAEIGSGALLNLGASSNYGRVLGEIEGRLGASLDRRTTLLILGDGRASQREDGADALRRLRERAKGVIWICPEPPELWGAGDSRMPLYAAQASHVLVARTGRELLEAARRVVRLC